MRNFITRVVLHNGEAYYEDLHMEMEAEGFLRTIRGENGKLYHLPDAEYYKSAENEITEEDIRDLAMKVVINVLKNKKNLTYSILTTGHSGAAWANLPPVKIY